MFVILDPMALPTASAGLPWLAAIAETTNSGADVPKPIIVSPTISGDMPKLRAADAAPATSRSAPQTRRMKPPMICINACSNI